MFPSQNRIFPVVLVIACVWSILGAIAAPQSPIGSVETVQGRGWGISDLGKKYDKLGGDLVVLDEVVTTDINSAMTLRFIDNTSMTLGPSAEITIDEMVYDPENGKNDTATYKLGQGSFYFVSGLVAKERVTLVTPTATIGIRGTELVINVGEDGATSVGVAKGHAFMRSNRDGRSVEVEVGNTARTDKKGKVSNPFPGIDLTGEEEVDRHIPGVSDWLDEEKEADEKDFAELADTPFDGDDEDGDGKDENGEEGERDHLGDDDAGDRSNGGEDGHNDGHDDGNGSDDSSDSSDSSDDGHDDGGDHDRERSKEGRDGKDRDGKH